MKSRSVYGNYETSRPEFGKPKGPTLADDLLPMKEIKNPKFDSVEEVVETVTAQSEEQPVVVVEATSDEFEVLKAAVRDFVEGDITVNDLKSVLDAVS